MKSTNTRKPYHLLLWTGLILFLISLIILKDKEVVDIHLHDTYFVVARVYLFWLLAIIAFAVWLLYALANRVLYSRYLTWIHVICTTLTLVLCALLLFFGNRFMNPSPRTYYDISPWQTVDTSNVFRKVVTAVIIILLLAQIGFVANVLAGITKKLLSRSS